MSDLGEFVDMRLYDRVTQTAMALASARAARAANATIRTLVRDELISREQGLQLSLQISGQLEQQASEPAAERPEVPAIEASTQARTEPEPKPQAVAADDVRRCPICGVAISVAAAGCRKHWRQVKREQAGDGQE